jgi:hypothetical protein
MSINFPNSPSVNDTHAVGDRTYRWDGSGWQNLGTTFVNDGSHVFYTGSYNVGIGTATPSSLLHVAGTTLLAGEVDITGDFAVDTNTLWVDGSNNRVGFGTVSPAAQVDISSSTAATLRLSNTDTGLVVNQITGQMEFHQSESSSGGTGVTGRIAMLSVDAGQGFYGSSARMGVFVSGDGTNGYASDNATLEALTILPASGYVGIGTDDPSTALDVSGVVTATSFAGDGSQLTGISSSGGGLSWARKTANYTASTNDAIIADTSGGSWTLTLPASPSVNDFITIADGANWVTNNLTVNRNSSTIEGDAADLIMNIGGVSVDFVYDGSTWQIYTTVVTVGGGTIDAATLDGLDSTAFATTAQGSIADAALPRAGGVMTNDLTVKGITETVVTLSGTTPSLDPTNGGVQTWTLSGNSSPTFGGGWSAGESITFLIKDGASHSITWPTMEWAGGLAPILGTNGYTIVSVFKVAGNFYGVTAGELS